MGFISALFGAGEATASIVQGQQAQRQQRRALSAQRDAQARAEARALGEERRSAQERRRLNRKAPNIASLLGGERDAAAGGLGSTLLSGSGGIDQSRVTLGKTSLLGGS